VEDGFDCMAFFGGLGFLCLLFCLCCYGSLILFWGIIGELGMSRIQNNPYYYCYYPQLPLYVCDVKTHADYFHSCWY
jgi:hypothetical protein